MHPSARRARATGAAAALQIFFVILESSSFAVGEKIQRPSLEGAVSLCRLPFFLLLVKSSCSALAVVVECQVDRLQRGLGLRLTVIAQLIVCNEFI